MKFEFEGTLRYTYIYNTPPPRSSTYLHYIGVSNDALLVPTVVQNPTRKVPHKVPPTFLLSPLAKEIRASES